MIGCPNICPVLRVKVFYRSVGHPPQGNYSCTVYESIDSVTIALELSYKFFKVIVKRKISLITQHSWGKSVGALYDRR